MVSMIWIIHAIYVQYTCNLKLTQLASDLFWLGVGGQIDSTDGHGSRTRKRSDKSICDSLVC